jgi:GntR family transcriptional regulator
MLTLSHASPVPLYYQLQEAIRREIDEGRWKPGDAITSERELMRLADVSRATVRQAIAALINEGLLVREHGRGTFVARPHFEQKLHAVYSFSEQIRASGMALDDRILQRVTLPAPPDLAELLGVIEGEPLIHLQRLRLIDGVPLMVNSSYLPYRLCPDLLRDDVGPSLYRALIDRYDLPPLRSRDLLEPVVADKSMAYHLHTHEGAALMYVERIAYTRNDLPLQVGRTHIRGDMCRFRVDLAADPSPLELIPLHQGGERL